MWPDATSADVAALAKAKVAVATAAQALAGQAQAEAQSQAQAVAVAVNVWLLGSYGHVPDNRGNHRQGVVVLQVWRW